MLSEKLKAKFGDLVENGWASEANPTRTGYFVREFRRPHGRMNAGLTWEITDGNGKFWELSPVGEHKITVTPRHQAQEEAKAVSVEGISREDVAAIIANNRPAKSALRKADDILAMIAAALTKSRQEA